MLSTHEKIESIEEQLVKFRAKRANAETLDRVFPSLEAKFEVYYCDKAIKALLDLKEKLQTTA